MSILDEAHHAAPSAGAARTTESQMTRAVRDIAGCFEHRLFLSATPDKRHSNPFATLLEILEPQRFHRGLDPDAPRDADRRFVLADPWRFFTDALRWPAHYVAGAPDGPALDPALARTVRRPAGDEADRPAGRRR